MDISRLKVEVVIKKRKSLGLRVMPDDRVIVSAPRKLSDSVVTDLLKRNIEWINARQKMYRESACLSAKASYEDGGTTYYLGSKRRVFVKKSHSQDVQLTESALIISVKDPERKKAVRKQIDNWYKKQAEEVFGNRLIYLLSEVKFNYTKNVELKTRFMKRLWGSCSSKGKINLNIQLVKTPLDCIDYVIMHEICHLAVMNHSKKFYSLLSAHMQDWKIRNQKLKFFVCN